MKNRILFAASLVFLATLASAQVATKWDLKPMPDGFAVPRNELRVHDGMLLPQIGRVWVDPNDENNLAVTIMPQSLTRPGNGPLRPAAGYEWVEPDNPHNFGVKPIGATQPRAGNFFDDEEEEDNIQNQPSEPTPVAASTEDLPPCTYFVPSGLRVLTPKYVPCKPTEVSQDEVAGQSTVQSQPGATSTTQAHDHEANGANSGGSGPNRSPAFMNPANPGLAPMVGEGMVETQKNYVQHNQSIEDAAKAMESVFGDPSKAKGNPSQNSGNHEAKGNGGSSGNGSSGGGSGDKGGHTEPKDPHGGTGDVKK